MRTMLKLAVPALIILSLAACKKPDAAPAADAGTAATPAAATASADSIGIAECDDYVTKVETCVKSKVPEAQRASVEAGLNASRAAWKQSAAQPAARDSLAAGCKQALAAAKTSYGAMGCTF